MYKRQVIAGNLFFGKINNAHILAVACILIMLIFLGTPRINLLLFSVFTLFAWTDEFLDKKNVFEIPKPLDTFLSQRISLELIAAVISIYTFNLTYFIAIMCFDISYNLTGKILKAFNFPPSVRE